MAIIFNKTLQVTNSAKSATLPWLLINADHWFNPSGETRSTQFNSQQEYSDDEIALYFI